MARWPYVGPLPACWPRRKTSASSSATNCSGCSKLTWTNRATANWPRTGTSDRVFPSGAARHPSTTRGTSSLAKLQHYLPWFTDELKRTCDAPFWEERLQCIRDVWQWAEARYWIEEYIRQDDV